MDLGNQSLIIQICRMYYEQKMTQQEIAELQMCGQNCAAYTRRS